MCHPGLCNCASNSMVAVWFPGEFELRLFSVYSPAHALLWVGTTSSNWMIMFILHIIVWKQVSLINIFTWDHRRINTCRHVPWWDLILPSGRLWGSRTQSISIPTSLLTILLVEASTVSFPVEIMKYLLSEMVRTYVILPRTWKQNNNINAHQELFYGHDNSHDVGTA